MEGGWGINIIFCFFFVCFWVSFFLSIVTQTGLWIICHRILLLHGCWMQPLLGNVSDYHHFL
uniref:Uncharacterized protein n=1 Tax=Octopus bimaculoides TaxID=37653 RepID=A0A0L8H644_OCTBM